MLHSIAHVCDFAGGGATAESAGRYIRLEWRDGNHTVTISLMDHTAERLHSLLGAVLQDRYRRAYPETCEDGSHVLAVDGCDAATADQLRAAVAPAAAAARAKGPVGLTELTASITAGQPIDHDEIARRAGF